MVQFYEYMEGSSRSEHLEVGGPRPKHFNLTLKTLNEQTWSTQKENCCGAFPSWMIFTISQEELKKKCLDFECMLEQEVHLLNDCNNVSLPTEGNTGSLKV